jgi:phosphonate transport system substrate-binding protein
MSGVGPWADGYSSGTAHKMVAKGTLDMNDVVEVWKSPLIPNGPTVVRTALGEDWVKKIHDFYMDLPKSDTACFNAVEGGDFTGYVDVKAEFYKPIIDAREASIGG